MRLFTAVLLKEDIKDSLCQTMEALRLQSITGNFTIRENLHLTLVFIGETKELEKVKKAMKQAILNSEVNPFKLSFDGLGRFSRREGDIYWVGVNNEPALWKIRKEMAKELKAEGFKIEEDEYRPHLTLGRKVKVKENFMKNELEKIMKQMEMEVVRISLMKSERLQGKLVYTEVYGVDL